MGGILEAAAPALISLGTGWVGRKLGKKAERRSGRPVQRLTAPLGAVLGPAIAAGVGLDLGPICELVGQVCAHPAALGAAIGTFMAGAHNTVNGGRDVARRD